MAHRIRWMRLALYVLWLMLPLMFGYILGAGALAIRARQQIEVEIAGQATSLPLHIRQLQQTRSQMADATFFPEMDDDQRAQALKRYDGTIAYLQGLLNSPETIDLPAWRTTLEAIVMPLARSSSASIVTASGGGRAYPAPIELPFMLLAPTSWPPKRFDDSIIVVFWLLFGGAMFVTMPLSLFLLPISLRRAKVRPAHLIRIAMYSTVIPVAAVIGGVLIGLAGMMTAALMEMSAVGLAGYVAIRYLPWLLVALWWHAATSRYLKIPHAWFTIAVLTLLCLLVQLSAVSLCSSELAVDMLEMLVPFLRF